jgi:general secretion pathway protein G
MLRLGVGVDDARRHAVRLVWRRGFTMIEILMVIALMEILSLVVVGVAKIAQTKAMEGRAQAAMERMRMGLEDYRAEFGLYPDTTNTEELVDWMYAVPIKDEERVFVEFNRGELVEGSRNNWTNLWLDPWGTPYRFDAEDPDRRPLRHNPDSYDLSSAGPDGEWGTEDDLTNW